MTTEDILESLVWGLPFFLIAIVFYCIALWKKGKGRGLHAEAQRLVESGDQQTARHVLLEALWKANEEPKLERRILADLCRVYVKAGVSFDSGDYEILIRQYEQLAKKGSHKAFSELKEVQALKKSLIDRMPRVAGTDE